MLQKVEVNGVHPSLNAQRAVEVLRCLDDVVHDDGVVRSVRTEELDDGTRASHWEVAFRSGILRWSQKDAFHEDGRSMHFSRLAGDPAELEGDWRAYDLPEGGCRIEFSCDFDLGIPSLAAMLDPLAARILRESISAQLQEIFGPELQIEGAVEQAAAAQARD